MKAQYFDNPAEFVVGLQPLTPLEQKVFRLTVKQAIQRGIITRFRDGLGIGYNADLCGSQRFPTGTLAVAAFVKACSRLNRPAE